MFEFTVDNLYLTCDNIDGDILNWNFDLHSSCRTYNWKTDKGDLYTGRYSDMPQEFGDMYVIRFKVIKEENTVRVYCSK